MPLNGMVLKTAGTNSVTGGTDVTFTDDAQTISNGVHLIAAADADFRTRRTITVKNKVPSYDAVKGSFSKDKKSAQLVIPKLLADGTTAFNLIRIEREVHPESSAAEAAELNTLGAQLLFDTDLTNFWSAGSVA